MKTSEYLQKYGPQTLRCINIHFSGSEIIKPEDGETEVLLYNCTYNPETKRLHYTDSNYSHFRKRSNDGGFFRGTLTETLDLLYKIVEKIPKSIVVGKIKITRKCTC